MFGGGRDDGEGSNPFGLLAMALLAPIAAGLLQMALCRSREFEADRSGARLIGDGEPLARALLKLEAGARQIPMKIDPAQAPAYIVNPLVTRRRRQVGSGGFANLSAPTPRPRTGSPASAAVSGGSSGGIPPQTIPGVGRRRPGEPPLVGDERDATATSTDRGARLSPGSC